MYFNYRPSDEGNHCPAEEGTRRESAELASSVLQAIGEERDDMEKPASAGMNLLDSACCEL